MRSNGGAGRQLGSVTGSSTVSSHDEIRRENIRPETNRTCTSFAWTTAKVQGTTLHVSRTSSAARVPCPLTGPLHRSCEATSRRLRSVKAGRRPHGQARPATEEPSPISSLLPARRMALGRSTHATQEHAGSPAADRRPGFSRAWRARCPSHWKRSLAAAVGVLVLLVLAAGVGGEASDDYSLPGSRVPAGDRSLPGALAGVRRRGLDARLHGRRGQGLRSRRPRRRSRARSRRSASSTASSWRRARSSRAARSPRTGAWRPSTCATPPTPRQIEKADGEALIAAAETAEPAVQVEARGVLIDLAAEQDAPDRRAHRRADRDRAADPAVPLRRGDGARR